MNEENLKGHGFHERTASEQREIAKMGGKASGKSRRKKADFRNTLNKLLASKIDSPEWSPVIEALGLESTYETALNMALIMEGLTGNVKAYEAIARYTGQSTQTEYDEQEQKIRIDRAKQSRDREIGSSDNSDENIRSFLDAINPSKQKLDELFAEDENVNGEETEKTTEV